MNAETKAVAKSVETQTLPSGPIPTGLLGDISEMNLESATEAARFFSESDLVPSDYRRKPANIVVAWQKGAELGLMPMQSLSCIAVVNGRASIYGNMGLALVQRHPEFIDMMESCEEEGGQLVARCTVVRQGRDPYTREFTAADAKQASLANVHKSYPKDMLLWRARWRALNGTFSDVLQGLMSVEEARDIPPTEREVQGEARSTGSKPSLADRLADRAESLPNASDGDANQNGRTQGYLTDVANAEKLPDLLTVAASIANHVEQDAGRFTEDQVKALREAVSAKKNALTADRYAEIEGYIKAMAEEEHIASVADEIGLAERDGELTTQQIKLLRGMHENNAKTIAGKA